MSSPTFLHAALIKQLTQSKELSKIRLADKAPVLVPLMVVSEIQRLNKHIKANQFNEVASTLNVYEHARFSTGEFLGSVAGKEKQVIDALLKAYYPDAPRVTNPKFLSHFNLVPHVFRVWFEFGVLPLIVCAVFFHEGKTSTFLRYPLPRERFDIDSFKEDGVDFPINQRNVAKILWKLDVNYLRNMGVAIALKKAVPAINEHKKNVDLERIMPTVRDLLFYEGLTLKNAQLSVENDFQKLGIDGDDESKLVWSFVYYNAGVAQRSGKDSLMNRAPDNRDKGGPRWLLMAHKRKHVSPSDLFRDTTLLAIANIRYARLVHRLYKVFIDLELIKPSPDGIVPVSPPGDYPATAR